MFPFFKVAFPILEPNNPYMPNWHIEMVCDHLEAVARGQIRRLAIAMPRRHLKSKIISAAFVPWVWTWNPSYRVINASYSEKLAVEHSIEARRLIESEWYQTRFCAVDGWALREDRNTQDAFATTRGGHRLALSVGGRALGQGANCVAGATRIATEIGWVPAEQLWQMSSVPRVWARSADGQLRLRRVLAMMRTRERPTVYVSTQSGRVLECTDDHRIWADGAYVPASGAARGSRLCALRENVLAPRVRGSQTREDRAQAHVLFDAVSEPAHERTAPIARLQNLRRLVQHATRLRRSEVLPSRVQARSTRAVDETLRFLPERLSPANVSTEVLLSTLREPRALETHDRRDELLVSPRRLSQARRRSAAPADLRTGCVQVRDLRLTPETDHAPYRRGPGEQHRVEPRHALSHVPCDPPQIEADTVSAVTSSGRDKVTVYDFQVEEDSCFFAEGILVHNCLIADDPDHSDNVYSKAERERVHRWWFETMASSVDDPRTAAFVIVQQRLHPEDTIGVALARELGYEYLCLPSEFVPSRKFFTFTTDAQTGERKKFREDPRSEEGELLFPERFSKAELDAQRKSLKSGPYAAQHQQDPLNITDALFKPHFWKFWRPQGRMADAMNRPTGCTTDPAVPLPSAFSQLICSVDFTLLGEKAQDWTVIQVWAAVGGDRYLLEQWRDKFPIPRATEILLDIHKRYPSITILIEESVIGPAMVADLRRSIPGVKPVKVQGDGGKEARAMSILNHVDAGNVFLPDGANWLQEFVSEFAAFPGKHDDQVDALSIALRAMVNAESGAALLPVIAAHVPLFTGRHFGSWGGVPGAIGVGRGGASWDRAAIARRFR